MLKFENLIMKKILIFGLVLLFAGCKDKNGGSEPVSPDYSTEFVGDYWTTTVNGNNSTNQTWVVTRQDKNLLNILYTLEYVFREQGKEIKSKEIYKLTKVKAVDKLNISINEDATFSDDGFEKIRSVRGNGLKITDAIGNIKIGVTFKFSDVGGGNPVTTDFLEFKKK